MKTYLFKKTPKEKRLYQPTQKRICSFCQSKNIPSYKDADALRKLLSDRGKIIPKLRTHLCSKHQRQATKEIKRSRYLALLPYTLRI